MDKTLVGLMMIFFLAFTVFITFVVFNEQLSTVTRASTDFVSAEKSLVFAWPLSLKADGEEESEITVFIRSEDGRSIEGKTVTLETTLGEVLEDTVVTDKGGKALFTLTSSSPGVAEITAIVDNSTVTRTVSVKFE